MNPFGLITAAVIVAAAFSITFRYSIVPDMAEQKHVVWRIDHWTGAVDHCFWVGERSLVSCDHYIEHFP